MRKAAPQRTRALRALVLGVTAWVAVVALGSTLVWAVISRAGEGVVGSTTTAAGSAGDSSTSTPGPRRVGSPAVRKPSASPTKPSQGAGPRAEDSSSPSATQTTAPTAPSSPHTSSHHHQTSPSPTHHTSAPPANPTRQRTWSGKAGSVTASCTGARISYGSALPQSGYRLAEWEYEGASQLKVKFEATGESHGETEVSGVCRNGAPQFRTESSGGGDD